MRSSLHVAFSRVWYGIFGAHRCSLAWVLSIFGGIWVVVVNSWWQLDGYYSFLVALGFLMLLFGGIWMVADTAQREVTSGNRKIDTGNDQTISNQETIKRTIRQEGQCMGGVSARYFPPEWVGCYPLPKCHPMLGVHYAHRYSCKPPNLGRRKKYTLLENMCVRGL